VYKLGDDIKNSKFDHKLVRIDDYISAPKKSGYRSLHLVYKYDNSYAPEYK
jgi:ppGpp synthetase/RelA/SpoT-type nucleotidyltranferase